MHNRHAWIQRNAEGTKREVRVVKRGGIWRFQAKSAGQEEWTYYDEAPLDDLAEFREILLRKYQRRRASYEDVLWAEREMVRLKALL